MNGLALQSEIPSLEISTSPCDRALEIILPAPQVGIWVVDRIGAWGDWRQRNTEFSWVTYVWPDGTIYYASDVKAYLEESWQAALGVPVVPVEAVALPEPVAAPDVSSGKRGLIVMAKELDLSPAEFERRLRTGWPYKVTEKNESVEPIEGTSEFRYIVEYSFNKSAARYNVENRDKIRPAVQKRARREEEDNAD